MNIKHTVAAVALLLLSCTSTRAQMVGSNCYLQNAWLEVGQALNGSFGPSSPPAGYHPVGGSNLAIVYDYGHDGWGVGSPAYYGDYTYPGTPFEGWSIEVNGARSDAFYTNASGTTFWNSAPGTSTLTGSNISGTTSTAVWRGSAGSSGNLRITQTTNVNPGDNWVLVTTVFRNVGTTTLSGLYYERHCDPDNDQTHSGNFVTNNNIVYQNDAFNRVLVNSMGTSYTNAYLALGTKDCRAKALIYDYWPAPQMSGLTLADIYNQTVPSTFGNYWYALGANVTSDVAIGLIYNLGSLAPGQTTSITYAYILDGDASIDAISFPPVSGGGTVSAGSVHCPHDFCAADPVSYVCSVSGNSGPGSWSLTGGGTDVTINPSTGALTVNPNMTTPLTVTACFTVTSGCESDRACCTFTVYPNPQFTVTGPTNACAGVPFTLGVSFTPPYTAPSHTYSWSTGATTSTMTDVKPCCASWLYTVTVTNTWGCSSQQTPAVTTFDNPPVAMMELCPSAAICVGQTTTLWAFGSGSYTSSWSATPPGIVSLSSSTLNSVVVTGTSAGTAIITYTVYNAAGCSKIATCSVTVTGGAGSITGPTTVCTGSTITLNQSTPGGTWTTSNGSIATVTPSGTNGVVTGVAPGTVIIGYSTGGTCGASVIVTVMASPKPVLTCPKDMCEGNSQFVPGDPTYNSAGYSTSWSSSSPSIALSGASGAGVTITGMTAGGATLTYAVTDLATGCTGYFYCNINIWPAPAPIGGPTDVCEGYSIALSGTPPGGTWISTDPTVATVDPSGVVTGISGGTVTIDYILPPPMTDCYSEIVVNVIGRATACVYWGFDPACGCNAFIFTGTPGATAYYDVYDCGGNYIFSASVTLDPTGMGVVYSWDVPDATCSLCITKVEFKGCAWPCLCPKGSKGNCCADKGKAKSAIGVTSVGETSRVHAHLEVVPNPNRGAFTLKGDISTSREVQIEVFDVVGQSVYSAKLSMKDHNINHAILLGDNVANGVYLIKISNAEVNEVLRFALKR